MSGPGKSLLVEGLRRRRELRVNSTGPEMLLWFLLRRKQLLAWKFRRQHPVGPYIVDFYCPDVQIAIELDGGQHFDEHVQKYDACRTSYLNDRGVRVVRFTNDQVMGETEAVLEEILRVIQERCSRRAGGVGVK